MRVILFTFGVSLISLAASGKMPALLALTEKESGSKPSEELLCEAGNAESCCQAGNYYQFLAPFLIPTRASALQERGCQLGAKACCVALELQRKGIVHVLNVDGPATIAPQLPSIDEKTTAPFTVSWEDQHCAVVRCRGTSCGCDLHRTGWKELARCPGHEWNYIMEMDNKRVYCHGISGIAGPVEDPCIPFTSDLETFKNCSNERLK